MKNSKYASLLLFVIAVQFLSACASMSKLGDSGASIGAYSGHGASSVDPALVAKYAPPVLDSKVVENIRRILEIQTPGLGILGYEGKSLYFTWNVTGVSQVWKLDNPMGFPIQMTSGADNTNVLDITPDGKYLILGRDHAGEENPGLFYQSTEGGVLKEIYHKAGVQAHLVWVATDGNTIYFTANDIKPDSNALYSFSIETGERQLLFSDPGLWFVADVWGDNTFLLGKATGSLTAEYYTWNTTERKLHPVIGQGEKEQYEVTFGAADSQFFVATPKFSEFKRLYSFHDGKMDPITPDVKKDVEGFSIDHSRMHLYIQWNDQGYSKLEVRDTGHFAKIDLPEFKDAASVRLGGTSRFGRYATLAVETDLRPRINYIYDWKEKKLTKWVRSSIPEMDLSKFSETKLESYPAQDGTSIPMLVTKPEACENKVCPVIVLFHGGPESQTRPGFSKMRQIISMAGFTLVEPNVRGSDGYGKTWRAADDGPKRLNVITDIEDCSKFIRKTWSKNGVTPKVGVMGWSYGGYSTLMAMTRFAGSYDAGVALVGMSNLRSFLLNTAPYRRLLRISEYGDPEKDKDALEKLSPTTYLDRVKDPLLIVQGVSDPRVPAGEAIQMHELLHKRGVEAQLILFAEEGHGASKRDDQVLEIGHALNFMEKHLR